MVGKKTSMCLFVQLNLTFAPCPTGRGESSRHYAAALSTHPRRWPIFLESLLGLLVTLRVKQKQKDVCFSSVGNQLRDLSDDDKNLHVQESEQNTVLQDEQVSLLHNLEFAALPTTMKAMQVHAHIQAAALRLFPDRKLLLADQSSIQTMRYITVTFLKHDTGTLTRFDLAGTWMLHSPAGESILWFVRALEGDSYYGLTTELCKRKYPSLVIGTYSMAHDTNKKMPVIGKKRPYMGAEDILKFLLSDFARQGPHNFLFEDERKTTRSPSPVLSQSSVFQGTGPSPWEQPIRNTETAPQKQTETVRKEAQTPPLEQTTGDTSPVRNKHHNEHHTEHHAPPPTYDQSITREYSPPPHLQCMPTVTQHIEPSNAMCKQASAQDDFMKTCCDMMKDVECSLQERRLMLGHGDCDEENTKKRKRALAADSIRNVTTILFAANKLLYADSQHSK
jgi:hypothetical protein